MKIHLISVGNKMPEWINEGVQTYIKRTPWEVNLVEIAPGRRSNNYFSLEVIKQEEAVISQYLDKLGKDKFVITLALEGQNFSTEELSTKMKLWSNYHKHLCFIIGGPDGLSRKYIAQSDLLWSLSRLTLPHMMVRIIVAEQLYRSWAILNNHPYHK